jgi:hypothetical protein
LLQFNEWLEKQLIEELHNEFQDGGNEKINMMTEQLRKYYLKEQIETENKEFVRVTKIIHNNAKENI